MIFDVPDLLERMTRLRLLVQILSKMARIDPKPIIEALEKRESKVFSKIWMEALENRSEMDGFIFDL